MSKVKYTVHIETVNGATTEWGTFWDQDGYNEFLAWAADNVGAGDGQLTITTEAGGIRIIAVEHIVAVDISVAEVNVP